MNCLCRDSAIVAGCHRTPATQAVSPQILLCFRLNNRKYPIVTLSANIWLVTIGYPYSRFRAFGSRVSKLWLVGCDSTETVAMRARQVHKCILENSKLSARATCKDCSVDSRLAGCSADSRQNLGIDCLWQARRAPSVSDKAVQVYRWNFFFSLKKIDCKFIGSSLLSRLKVDSCLVTIGLLLESFSGNR